MPAIGIEVVIDGKVVRVPHAEALHLLESGEATHVEDFVPEAPKPKAKPRKKRAPKIEKATAPTADVETAVLD